MLYLAAVRGPLIIAFALAGLFISVFYVAPPIRLKHHGLGEPGVFLTWGPLMVGGTFRRAAGRSRRGCSSGERLVGECSATIASDGRRRVASALPVTCRRSRGRAVGRSGDDRVTDDRRRWSG